MDAPKFDRIARLLAAGRGRRDFFRLLAGVGAALGGSPALAQDDDPVADREAAPVDGRPGTEARCGEKRDRCKRGSDCCTGLTCADGRCNRDDSSTCKAAGRSCSRSRDCCDDLVCEDTGRCAAKSAVKFERAWGGAGTGTAQLEDPEGIGVDPDASGGEEVYVADTGNDRIQVFSATGSPKRRWGTRGSGDTQFRSPVDVGINTRTGQVYVTDRENNRVIEFEDDGSFVRQRGAEGTGVEKFRQPRGLAVRSGSSTQLFVADSGNDRIQVLLGERIGFDESLGSRGSATGQFEGPAGVAVSSDYVVVADTFNNRLQVFRRDTLAHARTIGATTGGSGEGQFRSPRGVAIDDRNRIWVCDTDNNRVQVVDVNGAFQFAFGRRGGANGEFEGPRGIAVVGNRDDGYRIYVADTSNDRIQKFTVARRS